MGRRRSPDVVWRTRRIARRVFLPGDPACWEIGQETGTEIGPKVAVCRFSRSCSAAVDVLTGLVYVTATVAPEGTGTAKSESVCMGAKSDGRGGV
jgi:hypothetical protein